MNTTDYQPSYGLLNTRKSLASLSVLVGKALFGAGGSILGQVVDFTELCLASFSRTLVGAGSRRSQQVVKPSQAWHLAKVQP